MCVGFWVRFIKYWLLLKTKKKEDAAVATEDVEEQEDNVLWLEMMTYIFVKDVCSNFTCQYKEHNISYFFNKWLLYVVIVNNLFTYQCEQVLSRKQAVGVNLAKKILG